MSVASSTSELLDRVASAARGVEHGAVRVAEAQAALRFDEQEEAPFLLLLLSLAPPPAGRPTWPVDDLHEVRRLVRDRLEPLEPPLTVEMSYLAESVRDAEGEDEGVRTGEQLSAELSRLESRDQ